MDNADDLLNKLKSLLGILEQDTSRDTELNLYINSAISLCERYVDNVISRRAVTESWMRGSAPLHLKYWNAGNLSAVTLDGEDVLSEWKILSANGFSELHRADSVGYDTRVYATWYHFRSHGAGYRFHNKQLVATYDAGYSTCPEDLLLAIAYAAAALEAMSGEGAAAPGQIIRRDSITGIGSTEFDDSERDLLPPQTRHVLDLHSRVF